VVAVSFKKKICGMENSPKPYLRIILGLIRLLRKELFFAMRYRLRVLDPAQNGALQRILSFVTVVHGRVHAYLHREFQEIWTNARISQSVAAECAVKLSCNGQADRSSVQS